MSLIPLARLLIIIGIVFVVAGGFLYLAARLGFQLFNLPGDIRIERNNFTCLIGLGTSIFISILLTIGLNIIIRLLNR